MCAAFSRFAGPASCAASSPTFFTSPGCTLTGRRGAHRIKTRAAALCVSAILTSAEPFPQIDPAWLDVDNMPRIAAKDVEGFRERFEARNRPVVIEASLDFAAWHR